MFPVLALYGVSAMLFGYVVSMFARSQLAAFAYAAGGQAIMFVLSIMTFVVSTRHSVNGRHSKGSYVAPANLHRQPQLANWF